MATGQVTREILEFCKKDSKEDLILQLAGQIQQAYGALNKLKEAELRFSTVFAKMQSMQISSHNLYDALSTEEELQRNYETYMDAIIDGSEVVTNIGNIIRGSEYIYECGYFIDGLNGGSGTLGEVRISAQNMSEVEKNKKLFYLSIRKNKEGQFTGARLTTYRDATPTRIVDAMLKAGGYRLNSDQGLWKDILRGSRRALGRKYEQYSGAKYNHGIIGKIKHDIISWVTRGDTEVSNLEYSIQNKFLRQSTQISTVSSQSVISALQTYIAIYHRLTGANMPAEDTLSEKALNTEINRAVEEWAAAQFGI